PETGRFVEGPGAYRAPSLARTKPHPEAYRDRRAARLWARGADAGEPPGLVVPPYARWSEMAFLQHFLPGQPLEENGQRSAGAQAALYRHGDDSRLIAGVDGELSRGWLRQGQDSPTEIGRAHV